MAERGKLQDGVVEHFEAAIFSGGLEIGSRLPAEAEIARSFGISTRTVRDALQVLETKGLVQRRHGEYATVVRNDIAGFLGSLALTVKQLFSTDPGYFLELMDVRRIVELDVVAQLAAPDGTTGAEADAAIEGMRASAASGDAAAFARFDAAFHLGLVHSTPNRVLHVLYDNLFGLIAEVIQLTSRVPRKTLQAAWAEHQELWQLIHDKRPDTARDAMARHIAGSAGYLQIVIAARRAESPGIGKP